MRKYIYLGLAILLAVAFIPAADAINWTFTDNVHIQGNLTVDGTSPGGGGSTTTLPWDNITSRPTINSVTVAGAVLDNASNYPAELARLASPTFTGTATIPTPFTLGATSVTATGDQLNYVDATSSIQGQLDAKAPLVSPSFTTPTLGVSAATSLNTGQGANLLYGMDQSVKTTDNVVFASITTDEWITSCIASDNACGIGLGNQEDPSGQYLDAAYLWFNVTDDMVKVRNGDNTATLEVFTSGASHAGAFATTGPLSGALPVFTVTDNTTLARGTHTMNAMIYINDVARTITLPEVVASSPSADQVVPGAVYCVMVWGAHITRVDPHANDGIRLDGAAARDSNGDAIASTAVAGSKVCLIADSAAGWSAESAKGTWSAE